jgi:hypothetical protein
MAVRRRELLGCTLLLWTAAGLLALYLLCNPAAAGLSAQLGPTRLWGAVLGMTSLGIALPGRGAVGWPLVLAALPLVLLPSPLARRTWPAALGGGLVLTVPGLLWRRTLSRRTRGPRKGGKATWRRPRRRPAQPLRASRNTYRRSVRSVPRDMDKGTE